MNTFGRQNNITNISRKLPIHITFIADGKNRQKNGKYKQLKIHPTLQFRLTFALWLFHNSVDSYTLLFFHCSTVGIPIESEQMKKKKPNILYKSISMPFT